LPWMISSTNCDCRRAVHRSISSSLRAFVKVAREQIFTEPLHRASGGISIR
jgi:hypothetical protein